MSSQLLRFKTDLLNLGTLGKKIMLDLAYQELARQKKLTEKEAKESMKVYNIFADKYQHWYTESLELIRQILPNRMKEFESLYRPSENRRGISGTSFTIQDWIMGHRSPKDDFNVGIGFDDFTAMLRRVQLQAKILESAEVVFESSLVEITQLVQADLLDSEIAVAEELLKNGFDRAAGVIAGVALEKHLQEVGRAHQVKLKQHPTISDMNDSLKANTIIDIPTWRFIQRLGDLRNLCGHNKNREPTHIEVSELISGIARITKSVF